MIQNIFLIALLNWSTLRNATLCIIAFRSSSVSFVLGCHRYFLTFRISSVASKNISCWIAFRFLFIQEGILKVSFAIVVFFKNLKLICICSRVDVKFFFVIFWFQPSAYFPIQHLSYNMSIFFIISTRSTST